MHISEDYNNKLLFDEHNTALYRVDPVYTYKCGKGFVQEGSEKHLVITKDIFKLCMKMWGDELNE